MTTQLTAPRVLLISCYELGHQPLGVAWPVAALRQAGIEAATLDLAVQTLDESLVAAADFVAIAAPMHTALRLGVQAAERVRAANPRAAICFFGLYAWLNREYLLAHCADTVIGGEAEGALVRLAQALAAGEPTESVPGVATRLADSGPLDGGGAAVGGARGAGGPSGGEPPCETGGRSGGAAGGGARAGAPGLPMPDRSTLPRLDQYARYLNGGPPALAGYVEATRGCLRVSADHL